MAQENMNGIQKLAVLSYILKEQKSVELIRRLPRDIVKEIEDNMPTSVSKKAGLDVLAEFNNLASELVNGESGALLEMFDEVNNISSFRRKHRSNLKGFESLSKLSTEVIAGILKDEPSLNRMVILKHLDPDIGQKVFNAMPTHEQTSLTLSAFNSKEPTDDAIKAISNELEFKINSLNEEKENNIQKMLSFTDSMEEESFESMLAELPEDIAKTIRENTITFSLLLQQADETLSMVIEDLPASVIAWAIFQQEQTQIDRCLGFLSKNKKEETGYNIQEVTNPDNTSEIMSSQKAVIMKAKELLKGKKIEIAR